MTENSLMYNFLIGKDEVTPKLQTLGKFFSTSFANAQPALKSFQDVLKQTGVDFLKLSSGKTKMSAQDLIDTSEINHTLPTTEQLLKGVTEQSMLFSNSLKQIENAGRLAAQGVNVTTIMKDLRLVGKQAGLTGKQIEQAFKRGSVSANRFDARLLSLLFGGMALKRAFGGMLRSITETFTKAEGNTTAFTQKTTELGAAWEFLKFSLMDALNTPFFIKIIDGLKNVIDWFSHLSPTARMAIMGIIGGLALLGTALMIIGQMGLGWKSIFGMGGFVKYSGLIGWTLLGIIALVGLVIIAFNQFPDEMKSIWESIKKNAGPAIMDMVHAFDSLIRSLGLAPDLMSLFGKMGVFVFSEVGRLILQISGGLENIALILQVINQIGHEGFKQSLRDLSAAMDRQEARLKDYDKTVETAYANIEKAGKLKIQVEHAQTSLDKSYGKEGSWAISPTYQGGLVGLPDQVYNKEQVDDAKESVDELDNSVVDVTKSAEQLAEQYTAGVNQMLTKNTEEVIPSFDATGKRIKGDSDSLFSNIIASVEEWGKSVGVKVFPYRYENVGSNSGGHSGGSSSGDELAQRMSDNYYRRQALNAKLDAHSDNSTVSD